MKESPENVSPNRSPHSDDSVSVDINKKSCRSSTSPVRSKHEEVGRSSDQKHSINNLIDKNKNEKPDRYNDRAEVQIPTIYHPSPRFTEAEILRIHQNQLVSSFLFHKYGSLIPPHITPIAQYPLDSPYLHAPPNMKLFNNEKNS